MAVARLYYDVFGTCERLAAFGRLPPYAETLIDECKSAVLHDICDVGQYVNWDKLRADQRSKPRVVLTAHITSKSNLSVRWEPLNTDSRSGYYSSDFMPFSLPGGDGSWGCRPADEVIFIRGVRSADYDDGELGKLLRHLIVQTVETVIARLRKSYEITELFKLSEERIEVLDT